MDKIKFEVIVPDWDSAIRIYEAEDALHAAENVAEDYNKANGMSLLKESTKVIVRELGKNIFKIYEASAEEVINYSVEEITI